MNVRKFTVLPNLSAALEPLQRLARNLWWVWNPEAIALFRRIDTDLFSATGHNPVRMLGVVKQQRLSELAKDDGFLSQMQEVAAGLDRYLTEPKWFQHQGFPAGGTIAYFSAEFGLHESVPIYSGGLGILAGDHLKSASDLGLPLVGVGLLYQQGYFRQYTNAEGWQQERYPENDFHNMAVAPVLRSDGAPAFVAVEFPGRLVHAKVWRIDVGRVPLLLLDTNVEQNAPDDRKITAQLYGGDQDHRVKQELLLGVGGFRALAQAGFEPAVCHMNEGHAAFLAIERVATTMEKHGLDFAAARQIVEAGNVFTTHTPVEAGNDMFPPYLVEHYMEPFVRRLGIDKAEFLGLGRRRPADGNEPFCMTVLALRLADHANGVSALHGKVSRHMWRDIWPEVPEDDIPIASITNGIHTLSMLGAEMRSLYDRYFGPAWTDRLADAAVWQRAEIIPDAELWRVHERRRERLVVFARARLKRQLQSRGATATDVQVAEEALDPEALTIGFARRFATYKRGTLLLRDLDRLGRILNDAKRPVQLLFSGKAHPRDQGGKELIANIIRVAKLPEFRRRIVFVEDYDVNVARHLVQGVDVWLNNPRRPLEASGTSGMKGPINGALNLSVLDGWWCEGYGEANGWAIGSGEEYSDLNYQDDVESRAIYDLLEKEIVPLFYERGADRLPRGWIHRMKRSIATIGPVFNTSRMVAEYATRFYQPAAARYAALAAGGGKEGKNLAAWLRRVDGEWPRVKVEAVTAPAAGPARVGNAVNVQATVQLGGLTASDVQVDLYFGDVDSAGNIAAGRVAAMANGTPGRDGLHDFRGEIPCETSGQQGYAIRVLPRHPLLPRSFQPGLIRWG